ncbi:MAG: hypothetical protein AAF629_15690 [Chloroflexota bacterium]
MAYFNPKTIAIFFVITGLFLAQYSVLDAQFSDDIDIELSPSQSELAVGDRVTLTLRVRHPVGYQVIVPKLPQTWEHFDVFSQSPLTTVQNDDGSETTSQEIVVTLFDLGTFQTPLQTLSLRDTDNQVIERVIPQLSLTVVPTLPEDDRSLRDIKPQAVIELPIPWLTVLGLLAISLLLFILAWWLYRRLLKQPREEEEEFVPPPFVDTRPAYQVAFEELARIEQLDLPGQGRLKEYYSSVSDCLRIYLGGMYQIHAIDLTTAETKKAMQSSILDPAYRTQFLHLFSESDLVKFARFLPTREDSYHLISRARSLVDETKVLERVADPEPELETVSANPEQTTSEAL